MFDSAFAAAPIKAIKNQAELFGFTTGPDLDVSLYAIDTSSHVRAMKIFKPDVVWHGNTTMSVATTISEAFARGLKADHIVNNWGFDEHLARLAGQAAEGVMGAGVCAFYAEDAPMMDTVREYGRKYNPGIPVERRLVRTVQAWANVLALREALRRADINGGLNGENILKNGFETFDGFDIGLGVAGLTYTATDHRISGKVPIYEIKNGKIVLMTTIDLEGRWPDKWSRDWFGW
jgi:branched-chain amino acid transport system substrate-binding protein